MNLNNENTMENNVIVYVVMGGVNDEGENSHDAYLAKVFTNRDNAVTYGESLVSVEGFDYYVIVDSVVN
jgi:hypothetical protein